MKKITLFLATLLLVVSTQAQRISNLTIDGFTSCVPFAAFNPTNNSETNFGDGQIIFPRDVDLTNVNVTLSVGTEAIVEEPSPLPTDWSSTVSGIKVSSTVSGDWAKYNVSIKKINAAPLPLEIPTGAGVFDSDSWTPETTGWAGVCIDRGRNLIRLGSANRSFMVAFTDAPDSLVYTIKFLATAWDTGNIFDVDGSVDGVNWTSIHQYNETNHMPLSSPTVITKLKLSSELRYVRWLYKTRKSGNVSIENILVTKDTTTANVNHFANSVKLYPSSAQFLRLESSEEVKSLRLYNITGSLVLEELNPSAEIRVKDLTSGIYIGEILLKNGHVVSKKFIR